MATAPETPPQAWTALSDEELLRTRICDLGVTLPGSPLEPHVTKLGEELEAKGLAFRPECYLGDEWFSPEDVPAVSLPFWLAHPRLKALEERMMLEVEGGDPAWCQRLLRHECGHAIEHAYRLHLKKQRQTLFGKRSANYDPDTYRPQPYSRAFVRHLPNWYAQAHPDEDFAETFAVWLDPESDWKKQYRSWKQALAKLEYVDALMREIGRSPAKVTDGPKEDEIGTLTATLARYYELRRKTYETDLPDFYDNDLKAIFTAAEPTRATAAAFMRRGKKRIVDATARWTGASKITVELLVKRLTTRVETLRLPMPKDEERTTVELTSWLAVVVTNWCFTGKFKRSV